MENEVLRELPEDAKLPPDPPKWRMLDPFKIWIIALGLGLMYVFFFTACSTFSSNPQPEWVPVIYVPMGEGVFENSQNPTDAVTVDGESMKGMYLTPIEEISRIHAILNRCKQWD